MLRFAQSEINAPAISSRMVSFKIQVMTYRILVNSLFLLVNKNPRGRDHGVFKGRSDCHQMVSCRSLWFLPWFLM